MQQRILANRLAALATLLDDRMFAGVADLSESAVAALMVVRRSEPVAIQEIARLIGLTHSATVRLVDRLEKEWLVRRLSRRGREVMVETTARGKRRARDLQDVRLKTAADLIGTLDEAETASLAGLLDKLLAASIDGVPTGDRVCRLCEQSTCRKADCPVAEAGQTREGAAADA